MFGQATAGSPVSPPSLAPSARTERDAGTAVQVRRPQRRRQFGSSGCSSSGRGPAAFAANPVPEPAAGVIDVVSASEAANGLDGAGRFLEQGEADTDEHEEDVEAERREEDDHHRDERNQVV